jgi:hypothetical protein
VPSGAGHSESKTGAPGTSGEPRATTTEREADDRAAMAQALRILNGEGSDAETEDDDEKEE